MASPGIARIDEKSQMAKRVAICLIPALKNYNLYPEGHENRKLVVEQLQNPLSTYLRLYGDLRFEVEKNRILFEGEEIHSETISEGNLSAILYRDGLKWIEFREGIESEEIMKFLNILNKYWILSAEPEGDLVTALWEAQFSHIQYMVTDFYWGIEPSADFQVDSGGKDSDLEALYEVGSNVGESLESINPSLLEITSEEEIQLQEMVRQEEERDVKIEFLDVLLDNLLEQEEVENFKIAIDAIKEEFIESLKSRDFGFMSTIIVSLNQIRQTRCFEKVPFIKIVDDFFSTVSKEKNLEPLFNNFNVNPSEIVRVKTFLCMLPPSVISSLTAMMLKTRSIQIKQIFNDVIVELATKDIQPLSEMLNSPKENLVQKLVYILGLIKGEKTYPLLVNMTHHLSPLVRYEAIRSLLRHDPMNIANLFNFIDDGNDSIRRLILNYLGRERNTEAEKLLSAYIEKKEFKQAEKMHMLECFQALGRCGSERSIMFLKRILMNPGWVPTSRRSATRQGAAAALAAIGSHEALSVLKEAAKNMNPGIRGAAKKAFKSMGDFS